MEKTVEDAFFAALHQQEEAPPWLGHHSMGWIKFQWIIHWHPHHASPVLLRKHIPQDVQLVRSKWYRSGPYSNAHTFQVLLPGPWALQ